MLYFDRFLLNMKLIKSGESKPEPVDISIWIDSYSDMFSDFDPRSFSERTISNDFIAQLKKVSRDTKGKVSVLKLLVPVGMQKDDHEKDCKIISIIFTNNYRKNCARQK